MVIRKITYDRQCPICNKTLTYKSKYRFAQAVKTEKQCSSCYQKGKKFTKEHIENLSKSHLGKKLIFTDDHKKNISIGKIGVLFSKEHKNKLSESHKNKPMLDVTRNAIKKSLNGVCKFYIVNDLECQGTYEKHYIETLMSKNLELPKKPKNILTPYGWYTPDFEFNDKFIEIKSSYTYKMMIGEIKNYSGKFDDTQHKKAIWVNDNIKPLEIKIINKKDLSWL